MEKKDYSSTDSNYPEIVASDIIANIYNEDYIMFINNDKCIAIYKREDNYLKVDNIF